MQTEAVIWSRAEAGTPCRCLTWNPSTSPHDADYVLRWTEFHEQLGPLRFEVHLCGREALGRVAKLLVGGSK